MAATERRVLIATSVPHRGSAMRKASRGISVSLGFRDARSFVKSRSPLLPMFLIVLVDVFGFTIVIPLLSLYAEKFGASPLVATTLVSVYALCSLISTPIIGKLSDQYGRRPL